MNHSIALRFVVLLIWVATASPARAAWFLNGNPVTTAPEYQSFASIVSDHAGGAVVAWQDTRTCSVCYDVYAQRILSSGATAWPADVAVCVASGRQSFVESVSDGAGGTIVTWVDERAGATSDIYAQHVLSTGVVDPAWPANGRAVCTASGDQGYPSIASDGAGGAIITWLDYRGGSTSDIYAQRVPVSGVPAWTSNGRAVCTASGTQNDPRVVADGSGGVFVTWDDVRSGTDYDVYVQHLASTGALVPGWPTNGRALFTSNGHQGVGDMVLDGSGGVLVAFNDMRRNPINDVYAHHVLASGVVDPAWPATGRAVCTAASDIGYIQMTSDGAGGAIIAWEDDRLGITEKNVYAQRVNAAGAIQWTANGIVVCGASGAQERPGIITDGAGGAFVAWQDRRGSDFDIYAHHVLASGAVDPWLPADGRPVCIAAQNQYPWGHMQLVPDGSNGFLTVWQDYRGGSSNDLYAQHVGSIGEIVTSVSGTVRGGIWQRPYEPSASIRALPDVQLIVTQNGFQLPIPCVSDASGAYSITTDFTPGDWITATAASPWLHVVEATPPNVCGDPTPNPHLDRPVAEGPTLDFTWPASDSYSGDALNAFYILDDCGRRFWSEHMLADPQDFTAIVNDGSKGTRSAGGASTAMCETSLAPVARFAPGMAQYTDALCHEFAHAMVGQQIGALLAAEVIPGDGYNVLEDAEVKGLDEGLADYFTYAFTGDPDFGRGTGSERRLDRGMAPPAQVPWCNGYDDRNKGYQSAPAISGALYDLRKELNVGAAGAPTSAEFDRWVLESVAALRNLATADRTPVQLRSNLESRPLVGTTRGLAIATAFNRHNIREPHLNTTCNAAPAIVAATRTVTDTAQFVALSWTAVQSTWFYRVYLRYAETSSSIGPGIVVGDSIAATSFVYSDLDTAAQFILSVVPVDEFGYEGSPSDAVNAALVDVGLASSPTSTRLTLFPNPMHEQVTVRLEMPERADVVVRFYDIAGRLVSEERRQWEAGSNLLEWDGRDRTGARAAPGVYLCKVSLGKRVITRIQVLLR